MCCSQWRQNINTGYFIRLLDLPVMSLRRKCEPGMSLRATMSLCQDVHTGNNITSFLRRYVNVVMLYEA